MLEIPRQMNERPFDLFVAFFQNKVCLEFFLSSRDFLMASGSYTPPPFVVLSVAWSSPSERTSREYRVVCSRLGGGSGRRG